MDEGILFEEADFLLKRDWALDIDYIDIILWRLVSDEEFEKVLEHYSEYPRRVQLLLDCYLPKPVLNLKIKVIENGF